MSSQGERNDDRPSREETIPLTDFGPAMLGVGEQIGRYKLVRILGEGGFGIVYLAEQQRPIKRQVALKIIKPGMDSTQVIKRFEVERQALALLDHPNIARVYDADMTKFGRPYFVMEYVKGIPITEHCHRQKFTVEERLKLFVKVCEAIQHAHQKGIIHRDIKPSNIQVCIQGEQAVPKVIDFGVAKTLTQSLTERTLVTEQGQMLGTPEYISPEQAEMTKQDIDTRSDIYSLGVVLYELLTGTLPFESKTLRKGSLEQMREVIREAEPRTPSARVGNLDADTSTKLAKCYQCDVHTLRRRLRGDLDWITLKAMEKDRMRRYQTAQALAEDIERHLNHEPVAAGPPGTLYRVQKYVRRHQALVTGLAAVFFVLVAGIAGIGIFAIRADRQASIAQAVTDFLGEDLMGSVALRQAMNQEVTVRSILDASSERLEGKFADKPLVEAAIRQYFGRTYIELGDYRQAERHLTRANVLRHEQLGDKDILTLDSMSQLGRLHLLQGRYSEAQPLLALALESQRRRLGPDHVDTLETGIWLGIVYRNLHQPDALQKAEELLTAAFESCNRLFDKQDPITIEAIYALAFLHFGGPEQESKALPLCYEGWDLARKVLGEGHRLTFDFMVMGAWLKAWTGRFEEAERHAEVGIETGNRILGEAHPQTIMARGTLGVVYGMQHLYDKAEEQMAEAVRLGSKTLGKDNNWVLEYMCILGHACMMQGKYEQAERWFKDVRESGRPVYTDSHPAVRNATAHMITLYAMQERGEDLERWCMEELDRLTQTDASNRSARASILNMLAWYQATYPSPAIYDSAKALDNAKKACELSDHTAANYIDTLAAAYAETGDFAAAVREEKLAVDLAAKRDDTPIEAQNLQYHLSLFESGHVIRESSLTSRARSMLREGKYGSTEGELTAALKAAQQFLGESNPETRGCILGFIELYEAWNKPDEAKKWQVKLPQPETTKQ